MDEKKIVFIIVSIIDLVKKPLSYSLTRSSFTSEERAMQTRKTIESIRDKVPKAKIILLESGLTKELPGDIQNLVDEYIYVGNRRIVRWACDSPFKGLGEIISLLQLKKCLDSSNKFYFKISGRYYLNENFSIDNFRSNGFVFLYRQPTSISTVLYMVSGNAIKIWFRALFLTIPFCFLNRSIENIISRFIPEKKIMKINQIGVSGLIASDGKVFAE